MKKITFTLLGFLLGCVAAVAVVANPFHWDWLHPVQHRVAAVLQGPAPAAVEGRLWTCSMHPQVIRDEPGPCPICGMPLTPLEGPVPAAAATPGERKIKHWVAPMDPTYISDEPGKSPMGMDLVPVYEGEEEGLAEGLVSIDPSFVQSMGVQTAPVERADIPLVVRTVGTLTYDDEQVAVVTTKYEGWIENVRSQYVGQAVTRGEVLFDLYSPDLVATQKEYLDALAYHEKVAEGPFPEATARAASLVESIRQRLRYWDVGDEQIEALRARGAPERTLPIAAPVSGVIIAKADRSLEGLFVRPGMNLYEIADLSTIWAKADVFEHQIPWIRAGQRATVEFPTVGIGARTGVVRYLDPSLDPRTRTLQVSIELHNRDLKLRADMVADIDFRVPSARGVLTVPEEAVLLSGRRNIVIVDRGGGRFEPREVTVGLQGDGLWEIREGLAEGDRVVVSSQFLIDSESNLREAIRKIAASGPGGSPSTEQ